MRRLDKKVVIIMGASTGIGLASAKMFVEHGAYVYITGRNKATLDEAAKEIGRNVTPIQADVSKSNDIDRLMDQVRSAHGRIDVLFSNVGNAKWESLGTITETSMDELLTTNVKGTVLLVQKSLTLMPAGGSIILTGSISAHKGTAAMSVYNASKAAVRSLARSWAIELKGTGIRINVLSPGATSTESVIKNLSAIGQLDTVREEVEQQAPLGRMGEPEEVAAAALFLASDDSRFMTGSELFVDGGAGQI